MDAQEERAEADYAERMKVWEKVKQARACFGTDRHASGQKGPPQDR